MGQTEIPKIVLQEAEKYGYSVTFEGIVDGKQIYRTQDPGAGPSTPTGIPMLIVLEHGEISIVDGVESLRLINRLL